MSMLICYKKHRTLTRLSHVGSVLYSVMAMSEINLRITSSWRVLH